MVAQRQKGESTAEVTLRVRVFRDVFHWHFFGRLAL